MVQTDFKAEDDECYIEREEVVPSATKKQPARIPLDRSIRVYLNPLVIREQPYLCSSHETENIFPPSSRSWLSRLGKGSSRAVFTVRRVMDDIRLWLSILHPVSGEILEKHFIYPYEVWMLLMDPIETYRARWLEAVAPSNPNPVAFSIMRILEERLSWDEIAVLTNTNVHPTFTKSDTAWDDLEQLIPGLLQGEFRHEMKAFLAWTLRKPDLGVDPIEFFFQLAPLRYFKSLLEVHYRFVTQGEKNPCYLEILQSDSSCPADERATSETLHEGMFIRLLYNIMSRSPDSRSVAIKYCQLLNRMKRPVLRFPVTKQQSSRTRKHWMERFILFTLGLHLRAHIRPQAFGLKRVLYFGNAYRWPHPHLSWSAELDAHSTYPLHLQVLLMPPTSLEQAKRYIPSLIEVEWSARAFNPSLIRCSMTRNESLCALILDSIQREQSSAALMCKFGRWKSCESHSLSRQEARLLDASISRLDLAFLEMRDGRRYLGVSEEGAIGFLDKMKRVGAIQLSYEFDETHLPRPLFILVKGNGGKVRSLMQAVLNHSPSAVAYAGKGWKSATLISSLWKPSRDYMFQKLPELGREHGLDISCHISSSFRNYTSDVFQRLLMPDGSWFGNISGLVLQSRLTKYSGEVAK